MREGIGVTTAEPLEGFDQYLTGIDYDGERAVYHYRVPRSELKRALEAPYKQAATAGRGA